MFYFVEKVTLKEIKQIVFPGKKETFFKIQPQKNENLYFCDLLESLFDRHKENDSV